MIRMNVTVDAHNLQRRLNNVQNRLINSSQRNVTDTGIYLRDYMKAMTPKDTGETARSIVVKDMTGSKSGYSLSVGQLYVPHEARTKRHVYGGKPFNLLYWMMSSNKALRHPWRNGSVTALRDAIPMVRQSFRMKVRNDINKIVKT